MKYPLMPKATAIWLVENTALTFDQIAESEGQVARFQKRFKGLKINK